jgi:AcrR family transcriptional regulator
MKKSLQPRKTPQQSRSIRTREEILEATARLLNHHPFNEVSTNHIARKTGISIGTLYKYFPNKDSILAALSLQYMQQDAILFGEIFERYTGRPLDELLDELVRVLMQIHREENRVRGVIYQNLERLKLVTEARNATLQIHSKSAAALTRIDPALTWVAISAINAAVHATSQLPRQQQDWNFAQQLCRQIHSIVLQTARE